MSKLSSGKSKHRRLRVPRRKSPLERSMDASLASLCQAGLIVRAGVIDGDYAYKAVKNLTEEETKARLDKANAILDQDFRDDAAMGRAAVKFAQAIRRGAH